MSDELKPCPFCGPQQLKAESFDTEHGSYIRCMDCGANTDNYIDVGSASEAWNIRSAIPRASSEREFRDPDELAEYLGSLVSDDEEWDAAQAAMWGVRAVQGDAAVLKRLQDAIEGECGGLAITYDQAVEILHYVLQPLYYADGTPPPKESE